MALVYAIEYSREARRTLDAMPRNVRELLHRKIETVAAAPYARHNAVTRLQGRPEFRLRVHDWRVIYRVVDDRLELLIIKIGTRGRVYE